MPEDALDNLKQFTAILFGGIGLQDVDDSLPAKEFTFKVRNNYKQYVNYHPSRTFLGVKGRLHSEKQFDFVIICENNEGEFSPNLSNGFGLDAKVFSRLGVDPL